MRLTAVVLGIPGVGKTKVLSDFEALCSRQGKRVSIVIFGTVMLEVAKKRNFAGGRDDLRHLPLEEQKKLQRDAAKRIASSSKDYDAVLVDTHILVRTLDGYLMGLPHHVLELLKLNKMIVVEAPPEVVLARRAKDLSRSRDSLEISEIERDMNSTLHASFAAAIMTDADVAVIMNREGESESAADEIYSFLWRRGEA